MSKLDAIKARIAFHEKFFFAAMATVLALVGWTVSFTFQPILGYWGQQVLQWSVCLLMPFATIKNSRNSLRRLNMLNELLAGFVVLVFLTLLAYLMWDADKDF
jgi:hypothetical protein